LDDVIATYFVDGTCLAVIVMAKTTTATATTAHAAIKFLRCAMVTIRYERLMWCRRIRA